MATGAARHVLWVPGQLCLDPTSLSGEFPYGGTALGVVSGIVIRTRSLHHEITAEEWGRQTVEVVHGGTSFVLAALLRGYDADALAAVATDSAVGSPSGERVVRFRADQGRAGSLLSELVAGTLLFAPLAPIRHPAVLVHDAIPVLGASDDLALSARDEFGVPVTWYGRPDSSNRVADIGRIGDLSL
jgi:hypothetical protein